jgi:hypothetical protein
MLPRWPRPPPAPGPGPGPSPWPGIAASRSASCTAVHAKPSTGCKNQGTTSVAAACWSPPQPASSSMLAQAARYAAGLTERRARRVCRTGQEGCAMGHTLAKDKHLGARATPHQPAAPCAGCDAGHGLAGLATPPPWHSPAAGRWLCAHAFRQIGLRRTIDGCLDDGGQALRNTATEVVSENDQERPEEAGRGRFAPVLLAAPHAEVNPGARHAACGMRHAATCCAGTARPPRTARS